MNDTLLDSNILLRGADPTHPMHQEAIDAQTRLVQQGERLCLVPQNLVEFRAVATRPTNVNGLGMSQVKADAEIARLVTLYPVFPDAPTIFAEWQRLVGLYGAAGKQNHDARLAAAMNVHGIGKILTFNVADFTRYSGLLVVAPADVLAAS